MADEPRAENNAGGGGADLGAGHRGTLLRWPVWVLIVAVIAVAAARLCVWAWTQPVGFDGAMNLEVARSLADGNGYRRMYAGHTAFSHAIQTRAPYILPAALVFTLAGVGIWQAQLINLLYVVALAAVAFALLRRRLPVAWGVLAVAAVLAMPGMEDSGFNGYGEVPALVWWLLAVLALHRRDGSIGGSRHVLVAGMLIGVAIVTKTVLLIGFVATIVVFLADRARHHGAWRPALRAAGWLCVGMLLPIVAHEVWRAVEFGGLMHWGRWSRDEFRAILMQAGTQAGFEDTGHVGLKLPKHFRVLAEGLELPRPLLAAWIVLPLLMLATARRVLLGGAARSVLLMLLLFASIYFVWWLGVTPTQKAWVRRVFDGVLVWQLVVVLIGGLVWQHRREFNGARQLALLTCGTALVGIQSVMLWVCLRPSNWPTDEAASALAQKLAAMDRLPVDARLFGIGWYSMPDIALYSGRHIDDIDGVAPAALVAASPVYLVVDKEGRRADVARYWLDRYAHRPTLTALDLEVTELDTAQSTEPLAATVVDTAALRGYVDFGSGDYDYAFGFHARESDRWRWARGDVELLLRYAGEPEFQLDVYVPAVANFSERRAPTIALWLDACHAGDFTTVAERITTPRIALGSCPGLVAGARVRARLISDEVFDAGDDRPLAYIVRGIGFRGEPRADAH